MEYNTQNSRSKRSHIIQHWGDNILCYTLEKDVGKNYTMSRKKWANVGELENTEVERGSGMCNLMRTETAGRRGLYFFQAVTEQRLQTSSLYLRDYSQEGKGAGEVGSSSGWERTNNPRADSPTANPPSQAGLQQRLHTLPQGSWRRAAVFIWSRWARWTPWCLPNLSLCNLFTNY